jgi:hypothetical protein
MGGGRIGYERAVLQLHGLTKEEIRIVSDKLAPTLGRQEVWLVIKTGNNYSNIS